MKLAIIALLISILSFSILSQDDYSDDSMSFDSPVESDMAFDSDEVPPTPTPFPEDDIGFDNVDSYEEGEGY